MGIRYTVKHTGVNRLPEILKGYLLGFFFPIYYKSLQFDVLVQFLLLGGQDMEAAYLKILYKIVEATLAEKIQLVYTYDIWSTHEGKL